jgi:hypothetical protein
LPVALALLVSFHLVVVVEQVQLVILAQHRELVILAGQDHLPTQLMQVQLQQDQVALMLAVAVVVVEALTQLEVLEAAVQVVYRQRLQAEQLEQSTQDQAVVDRKVLHWLVAQGQAELLL